MRFTPLRDGAGQSKNEWPLCFRTGTGTVKERMAFVLQDRDGNSQRTNGLCASGQGREQSKNEWPLCFRTGTETVKERMAFVLQERDGNSQRTDGLCASGQ